MQLRDVEKEAVSGDDDCAETEGAEDVMDADQAARGDELTVQQEVEFLRDMLCLVVVVEEDEVEGKAIVGFKEVDCVFIEELDVGVVGAFQHCVATALAVALDSDKRAAFGRCEVEAFRCEGAVGAGL